MHKPSSPSQHTDRMARLHLRATFRDEDAAWSSLARACTEIAQDERFVAAVVSGPQPRAQPAKPGRRGRA